VVSFFASSNDGIATLRAPAQPVIDEHQRDHRLAHRHEARQQTGIVSAARGVSVGSPSRVKQRCETERVAESFLSVAALPDGQHALTMGKDSSVRVRLATLTVLRCFPSPWFSLLPFADLVHSGQFGWVGDRLGNDALQRRKPGRPECFF